MSKLIPVVFVFSLSLFMSLSAGTLLDTSASEKVSQIDQPQTGWFTEDEARTANPPNDLSISVAGDVITLKWSPIANATGYIVETSNQPQTGFTDITGLGAWGSLPGWITWTKSTIGTSAFFRVRSILGTGSDMALVIGGSYNMGVDNPPVQTFYMAKYEVTQSEFLAVMGYNPSNFTGDLNRPVERVSWCNAIEYCNRRSILEGLTPCYRCYDLEDYGTNPDNWPVGWDQYESYSISILFEPANDGYRLPHTIEWCFAAKGGILSHDYVYSGSNTASLVAWFNENSSNMTHPVGSLAPNELGIYDMSGNVDEWSNDPMITFDIDYDRVYLGGSCDSWGEYSAIPHYYPHYGTSLWDNTRQNLGFRVCRNGEQVTAMPQIIPPGGYFANSQIVTIECTTPASNIYYTTDGSEPTQYSLPYTGPITVSQSQLIKARAYCSNSSPSSAKVAGFIIGDQSTGMIYTQGGTYNDGLENIAVADMYVGKYEVTQAEFAAVMGYCPPADRGAGTNIPVYYVTWGDAIEFCNRRSIMEGLIPCYSFVLGTNYGTDPEDWPASWDYPYFTYGVDGFNYYTNSNKVLLDPLANGYRLPGYNEWEWAALGGVLTHNYLYSGSNDINGVGWYEGNSGAQLHAIGTKAPNELGVYDMTGNVREWCTDIFPFDPNMWPWSSEWRYFKCNKGGAWHDTATDVMARHIQNASYCQSTQGFRLFRNGISIVPSPQITPLPGIYNEAQTITLSSLIPDAVIRYTTDGSDPSETNGSVYSGPFVVDSTRSVKAIAIKTGWVSSPVAIAEYYISATLPEGFIFVHAGTFTWNTATITLSDFCLDRIETYPLTPSLAKHVTEFGKTPFPPSIIMTKVWQNQSSHPSFANLLSIYMS